MAEKGKKEKHEEQVQFAAFKQFCDDTTTEKQGAITEATSLMDQLSANIAKNEADAETLAREITQLDEDISVFGGDKKAATQVREIENTDYLATHKDYSESVDALEKAINVLKKQAADTPQASAELMQLKNSDFIPESARRVISAFLSQGDELGQDPEELSVTAPEANAYEFQSSGVVDMLQKLQDKFEDERTDLEKEEANSRHAYEMLIQDLGAQIDAATADRESKAQEKATKLQKAAEEKGELSDTTSTRDSDQTYLDDLVSQCTQKSSDFESRQQLRTDELAAIDKAIEILSSGAVSGNSEKYLPSLAQTKAAVSFLQLSSSSHNAAQKRVAQYLREKASAINSRVLSALAVKVEEDPFVKVKKMIKDLIVRLMEEANEEAEHKGWCDTELGTNEQTRKEKTTAVETLHSEIDQLTASIAKLTMEITDLTGEIAELDKSVAEMTGLRTKEKAKNELTISDSQDAQTAVAQALTVLKEFYEKAAEATALVQVKQPEVFEGAYTGMGGESGGVVGMLEVIQSDFARLETDTKAAEAEAERQFDEFTSESAVNRASMTKDVEHKTTTKTNNEGTLTSKKADLEGTQKELDAALAYYDKLKPSCVDAGVSYDDRVARRKEEIESLQEALRILNGEEIAFLQK
jgi:prefoldin subunit 5